MNNTIKPDWLFKNSEKLVRAYTLAKLKGYNVNTKETALKLLKIIDPKHAKKEFTESFSKMLQLFDKLAKKNLKKKLRQI